MKIESSPILGVFKPYRITIDIQCPEDEDSLATLFSRAYKAVAKYPTDCLEPGINGTLPRLAMEFMNLTNPDIE
jgi:hypothetical protein